MKRRIPVFILISVLLILVLTACAGAAEVKLNARDGAADDYFGNSVSISGDYVIVGAPYDDDRGIDSGSAYIFKRDGTSWSEQAKIKASDGTADDYFGNSISISGDYVIVGAPGDDDRGGDSGSAYIFKREGTVWSEQAKITASDGAASDHFGNSVSISGDYAIVGAPGDDGGGSYSGSTYIFKRDGTVWSEQAKIIASDGAAYDHFGKSVSTSGDYVIVGAFYDDDRGSASGSAYIFKRDGTVWSEQAKIIASDGAAYDYFGNSVSISGDYVIVGAYDNDGNDIMSGSAYIFKRDGTVWSEQAKIIASDGAAYDYFGNSVSISGDYAIVGVYGDDGGGSASGSAYIFKRDDTVWNEQAKITASDGAAYDHFGNSVSISGDYAIVGAYGDGDRGSASGSAYVYDILTRPPPEPTNLANTTGNYWVNYTWQAGTGNVTDSYNVGMQGTWTNGTTATFLNTSVGGGGWANISVWARNASGTETLSAGCVSDAVQAPGASTPQTFNCTCGDICVNETGWWRNGSVLSASSTPIQAAVDNAAAGETICVGTGSYSENVDVNKQLTLTGEGAGVATVTASNLNDHVFEVTADYVNISGFNVIGATGADRTGIYLNGGQHCNISNNTVESNVYGIYLSSSSNNTLLSNTVDSNNKFGIYMYSSSNNTLLSNTVDSNRFYGIYLRSSSNYNTLLNNIANSNIKGIYLESSSNNILQNNIANSNSDGIYMYSSSNYNILLNNTANSNDYGIGMQASSNYNTLRNNTANSNSDHGLYIYDSSSYNTLTSNTANSNRRGIGIYSFSDHNTLRNNIVDSNNNFGIFIYSSSRNLIYNNYWNNTNNAYENRDNIWNTVPTTGTNIIGGSWLGGNYWSDYAGIDTTGDGLGDTLIPHDPSGYLQNGDYHPLVRAAVIYTPPDPTNLTSTTGNFWVNHTWSAGSGNVVDSHNASVNGVWHNTTTDTFRNDTRAAHAWQDITVYAWNRSTKTLSAGCISQNTQIPNNPVTVTNTSDWSGDTGNNVYVDYNAIDSDSDTPTFSCNRTDLFTDFSDTTGHGNWTTTYTDAGVYYVDFGASDGWGSTSNYTMTIIVNGTVLPVIHSVLLDPEVVLPNGSIIVTVTATDESGIGSVTADGIALTPVANDTYVGTITAAHNIGTYKVTVVATDASPSCDNATDDSATYRVQGPLPLTILYIEDVAVRRGVLVTIPIMVFDVANMSGCEINLTYDPEVVYVIDVAKGDMNFPFEYIINSDSVWVRANALDVDGRGGNVTVAYVTLAAMSDKSDVSEIAFGDSRLLDVSFKEIAHVKRNGTFSILENAPPEVTNVSATPCTILYDNRRPRSPGTNTTSLSALVTDADGSITAVTINLSSIGGSPTQPMEHSFGDVWEVTTNATEVVAAINAPDFTHRLAITATDDNWDINDPVSIKLTVLKRGDVNGDGSVDKMDADYISRYLAGLEPEASNPPSILTGDVIDEAGCPVGNDVVDLMDALYLAKCTSDLVEAP